MSMAGQQHMAAQQGGLSGRDLGLTHADAFFDNLAGGPQYGGAKAGSGDAPGPDADFQDVVL
jgi:hypothetical protein